MFLVCAPDVTNMAQGVGSLRTQLVGVACWKL